MKEKNGFRQTYSSVSRFSDTLPGNILKNLKTGSLTSFSGLSPSCAAFLASQVEGPGEPVVICSDEASARTFSQDLSFFLSGREVLYFPPPESLPYSGLMPDAEATFERIAALYALGTGHAPVVIPAASLLYPVLPRVKFENSISVLKPGYGVDRDDFIQMLDNMGYRRTAAVLDTGEFAVRGGILDIFSPGAKLPVRVELWDESVRSIRTFDLDDQRSIEPVEKTTLLPGIETYLTDPERLQARARLMEMLTASGLPARERETIIGHWDERSPIPGEVLYTRTLFGMADGPLDYLGKEQIIIVYEPEKVYRALDDQMAAAADRGHGNFPGPDDLFIPADDIRSRMSGPGIVHINEFDSKQENSLNCRPPLLSSISTSRQDRLDELGTLLSHDSKKTIVAVRSHAAAERLASVLAGSGKTLTVCDSFADGFDAHGSCMVTGSLSAGFSLPETGLHIISDSDLFGQTKSQRRKRAALPEWDLPIGSISEGETVVHIDHGIGLYEGLKQLQVAGSTDDFLHLHYAGGDSLYVPVWEMNRVQRYRSSSETPPSLSKLGSQAWQRSKGRVQKSLRFMAEELLKLSAAREHSTGHSFDAPDSLYREFEASFPWTETADQERSIADVLSDMTSLRPMDRLICGDVGFGKTEVAMRAAFLAASDGKQTAVLVPTTVLAQQHFNNFTQRLQDFPVTVGQLSRFVSNAGQKKTIGSLATGELDIIIGTHRLLSDDVIFNDLGLLVIDEEHRFGVREKEKLKKMRETVDVLTLSATPIPRTLHQAFSGLRSLSLIHTPPPDRKSVHTEVRYFDEDLIRDAILREVERGGQVYVVHNRVQTIEAFKTMLQTLVPEARFSMAHGQMGEAALENIMIDFLSGGCDVLVSTAIIESGLDISNANTLIINRADRFGLAQLYQLRGRVGRSSTLAYAYLFIPSEGSITDKARQRLRRLRELTELGSGFKLATFDLEMRGAGNLLGAEQSGKVHSVGVDLYSQLLEQAVREVSGEKKRVEVDPAVTLPIPAFLPEDYLPDVGERLVLYKRIASVGDEDELESLREEVADRFGALPQPVTGLFERMEVYIQAKRLSVERIDAAGQYIMIVLHPDARVSPDTLMKMLSSDHRLRFIPPTTLRLDISSMSTPTDRVFYIKDILRSLL